jgi:hypothetical protein
VALVPFPSPTSDSATQAIDAYLLEIQRQAAESTRPSTMILGAFLAFVGVMTIGLVALFSIPEGSSGPFAAVRVGLGVVGLAVSVALLVVELDRDRQIGRGDRPGASDGAVSSIYLASSGFFAFAIVIAGALLLLR